MGMPNPLQIILHFCRNIFIFDTIFLAIKGEKVAVQDHADALEQTCIYAFTLEDVIHIGAVTVQLVCEPSHTALLAQQLCLDFFTDVYWHFPMTTHNGVSP